MKLVIAISNQHDMIKTRVIILQAFACKHAYVTSCMILSFVCTRDFMQIFWIPLDGTLRSPCIFWIPLDDQVKCSLNISTQSINYHNITADASESFTKLANDLKALKEKPVHACGKTSRSYINY